MRRQIRATDIKICRCRNKRRRANTPFFFYQTRVLSADYALGTRRSRAHSARKLAQFGRSFGGLAAITRHHAVVCGAILSAPLVIQVFFEQGATLCCPNEPSWEDVMRSFIVVGSSAILLALGASGTYANGPLYSPYEVLAPQPAPDAGVTEGRGAYTDGEPAEAATPHRHGHAAKQHVRHPEQ
jgi:hypothetical protein